MNSCLQKDAAVLTRPINEQQDCPSTRCAAESEKTTFSVPAASSLSAEDFDNQEAPALQNPINRVKTSMAAFDKSTCWDSYETSQKRDFFYRPSSTTPVMRPMKSRNHRNSCSSAEPVGPTAYREDFCWKPPSKPASIRTGSASGNTRNNPHPSQSFMVWRLPKGKQNSTESPWKSPLTEKEVRDALSAQYHSTYRTDYLGIPQGFQMNRAFLAPLSRNSEVPHYTLTEMRLNYQQPQQKPELRGNISRYGCNPLHRTASKGVVPTVVPSHISNQENRTQLTTYNRYFGQKMADISCVLPSLGPKELLRSSQHVPEKDKEFVPAYPHQAAPGSPDKRQNIPTVFSKAFSQPKWMSDWPGPL